MNILELSEQEIQRRNALDELRALGINPYPADEFPVDAYSDDIKAQFSDEAEEKRNNVLDFNEIFAEDSDSIILDVIKATLCDMYYADSLTELAEKSGIFTARRSPSSLVSSPSSKA